MITFNVYSRPYKPRSRCLRMVDRDTCYNTVTQALIVSIVLTMETDLGGALARSKFFKEPGELKDAKNYTKLLPQPLTNQSNNCHHTKTSQTEIVKQAQWAGGSFLKF